MGNGNTKSQQSTIKTVMQANMRFRRTLNLWQENRIDREPWNKIINNAPSVVYARKRELIETKDDEFMEDFYKLLEGQPPRESRKILSTKEVALFLSSTFTDMKIERDILMTDVYPYLREFCRRLGYDFSVTDLRWGVRDQMTDEHHVEEICVTEVQRCRAGSVGPYMACIIGERYGHRPLPNCIPKEIFEMILGSVRSRNSTDNTNASGLLEKWFKLDENNVPPVYVLLPVSTHYPHAYKDQIAPNGDKAKEERRLWWKETEVVRAALSKAASQIDLTSSNISESDFIVSITTREVETGVKGEDYDPRYMFLFLRSLRGVADDNNNKDVSRFVDAAVPKGSLAEFEDRRKLLEKLRGTCEEHVSPENIYRYTLDFHLTKDGNICARKNQEAIKNFCDQFCQFMVDGIQEAVASHNFINDPLFNEVLNHALVAKKRTDTFVGRANALLKIEAYLKSEHGSKPFIVHGMSGCGKTSVLAKAFAASVENWNGVETGRPIHIIRFLGTSPASSNIRSLLSSLCKQLCLMLKDSSTVITDNYDRLVVTFRSLLQKATPERPLVLFLDSLDQLSDQDDGLALKWLPISLPKNVHVVLSTLPNLGGCLAVLRTKLKQDANPGHYLEVSSLETNDTENVLKTRLEMANRRLTDHQRKEVLDTCPKPTALYMKLACDTALRWKSFSKNTHLELKTTATQMITLLFERLIGVHGEQLVRRALGYITASRTGLTKTELEDILSCDDIVLDDEVFKYNVPALRRLPPLLWTRLRSDLGSYLVEVSAEGHVVYKWYHRLFLEAARSHFLGDRPLADSLHFELANYFNGRWSREAKPYTDRDSTMKSALRMVANQPLLLSPDGAKSLDGDDEDWAPYNLRKLSELPYHLIKSEMWNEFVKIVCKIPWLIAKCKTGKAYELTLELSEACLKCNTDKSTIIEDVYSCIRANAQQLSQFPELVPQLCLNEPDSSYCAVIAKEYLEEVNSKNGEGVTLWRDLTKMQSRKTNVATFQHPTAVKKCWFSKGCKFIATYAADGILRVFMIFLATSQGKIRSYSTSASRNGKPVLKEELSKKPKILAVSLDGKFLASGSDQLYLWCSKSLKAAKVLDMGKKVPNLEGGELSFSSNGSKLGAVLANGTYIWSTQSGKLLKTLAINCLGVEFAVFAPDLDYIASQALKAKEDVLVLCMAPKPCNKSPEWETLKGHASTVKACCIGNRASGRPLIATASDDCTVQMWDTRYMPSPKVAKWPKHSGSVQECAFSRDDTLAVSCSSVETWVWQIQAPVRRLQQLHPPSNAARRTNPCFSEDNQFVAAFAECGVDVWHLKSGVRLHGADTSLISGAHRTLTFLDVHHLFTMFTSDGLYSCLVTEREPHSIRLYLAVNRYTLDKWVEHKLTDSPPNDLNAQEAFEQRFSVAKGQQIVAAVISNICNRLAVISVPRHQLGAQERTQANTELHLWDLSTHSEWNIILSTHPTTEHVVKMGPDFVVTLVQGRTVPSAQKRRKLDVRRGSVSNMSRGNETSVRIINEGGSVVQTLKTSGMFSGVSGIKSESSVRNVSGRLVAYGLEDGVVKAQQMQSKRLLGTFTVNNTQITAAAIASSGKCAVVGCANGIVHIIEMS